MAHGVETLEERLIAEGKEALAEDALSDGDARRGAGLFYARSMACSTCHSVGDRPAAIGPDLAKIDPKTSDAALIESILQPSKSIAAGFANVSLVTADGRSISGLLVEENDERLVLRDAAQPDKLVTVPVSEIEDRRAGEQSIMPGGQINQLANRGQFLDLVRYLIELRDGGAERARELQPPPDALAQQVPDAPLPWRPVVQRGEVAVEGDVKYPHAVAIGFVGGSALFDAKRLRTVATWKDGFVKHTPQNYFGLYWQRDGGAPRPTVEGDHPLTFKLSDESGWQAFEPAETSDPNLGTRFEGYEIGQSAVRLHYRAAVGPRQIQVSEDVRFENRPAWSGLSRRFRFTGLPSGGQASISFSTGEAIQSYDGLGNEAPVSEDSDRSPILSFRVGSELHCLCLDAADQTRWAIDGEGDGRMIRLLTPPASNAETAVPSRIDVWTYQGLNDLPSKKELEEIAANPPSLDDALGDVPSRATAAAPPSSPTEGPVVAVASRPGVQPQENVDQFPPVRARFLRFVVTATSDDSAPGIDELEVYGTDPTLNLALAGKASASSVISGYPIHQIAHLNDGKLGNEHSWISAENGGGWAQIEFPKAVDVEKIVWARDRTGVCRDRLAVAYRIEVSDDGERWTEVGDESGRASPGNAIGAIRRDATPGYVMEEIPGPFPTWRPSDVAFDDEGNMYAIAMTEGQIWRAKTPPKDHPEQVRWSRYASGLYHPIGLAIVDGRLFVAQKPEITELIDRDGDGTVDRYRTVATGWGLSTGWHEYTFGLGVDREKNLWFALNTGYFWTNPGYVNPGRMRGSILRVAYGTEKLEQMATGCRVPNGIASGPDGEMFFTDNQGDWIQACKLAQIVPGRFFGHPETAEDALPPEAYPDGRSAVWLPYERARSVSGPVVDDTAGRFGPFAGQMFVGDVGYGANAGIMRIALEKVDGEYQGACFRFIDGQPLGCERMTFGPDDQLYMSSLTSGLTRVAFDGSLPFEMRSVNVRPRGEGFVVHLTKPLAGKSEPRPEGIRVRRYHYLYTGNYGSPEADVAAVPVVQADVSDDRTSITLSFPVVSHPLGMVYEIDLGELETDDGQRLLHHEAWYTVHRLPE